LTALGQDIQYTQNTADQIKRSGLTVDPSTLGLNLEIPLADYAGRAGASLPVALQYSSKVWHMEYQGTSPSAIGGWVSPTFATWGGWTSTLDRPDIALSPLFYASNGSPNGVQSGMLIYRINVTIGGSIHEFRKSDTAVLVNYYYQQDWNGTYYAVDGSQMRLEYHDGAGAPPNVLYLPSGSRYIWGTDSNGHSQISYIDRNGNTLTYSATSGQWTDTLGRVINAPVLSAQSAGYTTYSFTSSTSTCAGSFTTFV
jgi:hypothetical protein